MSDTEGKGAETPEAPEKEPKRGRGRPRKPVPDQVNVQFYMISRLEFEDA